MKMHVCTLFLVTACGTTHVKPPQVIVDNPTDTSTATSTSTQTSSRDSSTSSLEAQQPADNTLKALHFGDSQLLKNVTKITSATKLINVIYFTGEDANHIPVLGILKPDGSNPVLKPFGQLATTAFPLGAGNYTVISNSDSELFVTNDTQIVGVDLVSLQAKSEYDSSCSGLSTFSMAGRWIQVWNSKATTCGVEDGQVIESQADIVDGYTAQPLKFDNYSTFSFDGINIYQYDLTTNSLTFYDHNWTKGQSYSTSGYPYNRPGSSFVGDSEGHRWMLGCDKKAVCYLTPVTIVEQ